MGYGKIIGALIGLSVGHSFAGAIIGAFIGHLFDVERSQHSGGGAQAIQALFFRATFQLMGHIAKADGRVSEQEIQAARQVMAQFRLSEADVTRAIECFTEGKASEFPLNERLKELSSALSRRMDLRLMFVQIQLQASLFGGGLNPSSRVILDQVCAAMGISAQQLAQMESMLRMHAGMGGAAPRSRESSLSEAYQVLGLSSGASDAEVAAALAPIWQQRSDRYSELRASLPASTGTQRRRIEMSYIGG